MRKKLASLLGLIALLGSSVVSMPAYAAADAVFDPASGTDLVVNDTIDSDLIAAPQTVGTYDAVFEQTWDSGSVVPTAVDTPLGWEAEYLVDGVWQNTEPTDLRVASGVRSQGQLEADGINTNRQQLTERELAGAVTPGVSSIASTGRGDGWDVILTPNYVVNVFHHASSYRLECHHLATGEVCEPILQNLYTVTGYLTSQGSGGAYHDGNVYSYVVRTSDNQTGVLCTNVSTLPFTACSTPFFPTGVAGTSSATDSLGTQATVGSKIWLADSVQKKLLCFDMAADAVCNFYDLGVGYAGASTQLDSFLVNIDSKLYLAANQVYCIDPQATPVSCGGSWPVASSLTSNVLPMRTYDANSQTYTLSSVCSFWTSSPACWDLTGATTTVPAGYTALLNATSTSPAGGIQYFQTTAWNSTRVFWTSNATGSDWSTNYLTCYDYALDAACADFVTPIATSSAYAAIISADGNCVWTNGDSGVIGSNNALTGEAGCLPPGAVAEFTFDAAPSCTTTQPIWSLDSLNLTLPVSVTATDLTLKVFDSNGIFTGFNEISLTTSIIDLSGIDMSSSDGVLHFQVASETDTVEDLELITAALTYVAEPLSMCVTLVVVPSCPATLSTLDGFATTSQPDVNVSSSVSMTKAGVEDIVTRTSTYEVGDFASEGCWQWESMLGETGGVNPAGAAASVADFLWTPDGTMYIGGYFANAGGDAAADNLAKWDGDRWSAVAPIDETTSSINQRVAALALSPNTQTLYVGGKFTNVNGDADIDYFTALDIANDAWSAGSSTYNFSDVNDIAVNPETGAIYVGGTFTDKLVLVNPSADSVEPVGGNGAIGGTVYALEFGPDGNLYVGGSFTNAGAVADADYAAMWDGASWLEISDNYSDSSSITSSVTSFAWGEDALYIGGLFSFVASYNATDDQWTSLAGLGGQTRSLAVASDGTLYAAGTTNYTNGKYFARYVGGVWKALPVYNYASQGFTTTTNASTSIGHDGWTGAWNVDLSPTGDVWFGGDFTEVNGNTAFAHLAHWGFEYSFGGYAINQPTPPGYDGPVVVSASKRSPNMGNVVTLFGKKLSSVTEVYVDGHKAEIVETAEGHVTIIFPFEMPAGVYDVDLISSYGKLTLQDAFEMKISATNFDDTFKFWTRINEELDTVRIYAKDIVGMGKVQFFVDGKEIAWVRAADQSDPKLLMVGPVDYMVRKVDLHEGKNRFEIKLNGVRVWRTTYVPVFD